MRQAILAYAKARGRPIAAIINSHWHLDHTTGNYDIRQVYPRAEVYATNAIEGALVGFLGRSRAQADKMLADPKMPAARKAEMLRGRSVIDHPDRLRPTRPVLKSARMKIAGRTLDVHVAPFAATEADLWFYDPKTKLAVVGDLVVGIVPFMDTACPDGWAKALDAIAKVPFTTLIPGHGEPMTRADFLQWRTAYNNLARLRPVGGGQEGSALPAGSATRRSSSTPATGLCRRGARLLYRHPAALVAGGATALLQAA